MHLLLGRAGAGRLVGRVREVRHQPAGGRQIAALRRDVLDQVAARRRRRDHRADLQGARGQARLWLRRLGLEDGLQGSHRDLMVVMADDDTGREAGASPANKSLAGHKNKEAVTWAVFWQNGWHRLVSLSVRWRS